MLKSVSPRTLTSSDSPMHSMHRDTTTPRFSKGVRHVTIGSSVRRIEEEPQLGADVLKTLNFALNPTIHHRKKKKQNYQGVMIEQLKNQVSDISKATKALAMIKEKKKLKSASFAPLVVKPKLKQSHGVVRGTMSYLMNDNNATNLPHVKRTKSEFINGREFDISVKARSKLRTEMVGWLIANKKPVVNKINENQQIIISWIVYLNYISRPEFDELLGALGIKYDPNLFDRLFRLFDLNDNGVIDQKEVLATLELFKEHSFEEKLKIFFELVDDDDRGLIDEEKLVRFFKKNLRSEDEIKKVKPAVRNLVYRELELEKPPLIHLHELARACEVNEALKSVVEANVTYLKTSVKPKTKVNSAHIIASQLQLGQGGFSLPYMERLVGAFEEKEMIGQKHAQLKKDYIKQSKYLKEIAGTTEINDQDNF